MTTRKRLPAELTAFLKHQPSRIARSVRRAWQHVPEDKRTLFIENVLSAETAQLEEAFSLAEGRVLTAAKNVGKGLAQVLGANLPDGSGLRVTWKAVFRGFNELAAVSPLPPNPGSCHYTLAVLARADAIGAIARLPYLVPLAHKKVPDTAQQRLSPDAQQLLYDFDSRLRAKFQELAGLIESGDDEDTATEKLAAYVASTSPRLAEQLRKRAQEGDALWSNDTSSDPARRAQAPALAALSKATLFEIETEHAASASATRMRPSVRVHAGDAYAKIDKLVAPVSWAFGAPGVQIDGEQWAEEPGLCTRLVVPRSYALFQDKSDLPTQAILPLVEPEQPLPVAVVGATQYAIGTAAGKVALLALATDDLRQCRVSCTLGELARVLHPNHARIREREVQATAAALHELDGLIMYLPDRTRVRIFSQRIPWTKNHANPDTKVTIGFDPRFAEALLDDTRHGWERYKGAFVLNLSGALRQSHKHPARLRLLIRAAAEWNASFADKKGTFSLDRAPRHTAEYWAALTNSLPTPAAEYLRARKGSATVRKQLSDERKRIREDLEALEADGLMVLDKPGPRSAEILVLPPDAFHEAKNLIRKDGRRRLGLGELSALGAAPRAGRKPGPK